MNFIILDLEWNAAYSKKSKSYINEIIEFGAVKCDENLNIISTFSSYVRFQVGKKLNAVVSELTSIKDENLNSARPYMNVLSKFKRWAGENNIVLTWGISDILALTENCKYFSGSHVIPFLNKYVDLQKYAESLISNNGKEQMGLYTAAQILSVDASDMEHHRALDDSLLALAVMKRLWPQNSIDAFVQDAKNNEFYNKITFKTSIINDMSHPLVTNKNLMFSCDKCGGEAKRLSKWQFRNKRFVAEFKCPNCAYEFSGRIQIKQKYEGVVVNKKTVSLTVIEKPRETGDCSIGEMNFKVHENKAGLLSFKNWEEKDVKHCFSTRIGGLSKGKYADMNLGLGVGDNNEIVHKNFELMCQALDVNKEFLISGNQNHGINIKRVTSEFKGQGINKDKFTDGFDGLVTDEKGITLVIYAADCVPIYYFDPIKSCIGLAHAGWRGTANGMAKEMVEKMVKEFSCDPKDILVAIGPCICENCFEVDPPCADEFLKLDEFEYYVDYIGNEKYHVDLKECNRRFLMRSGIKEENITVGNVCTMCNSNLIFSHRKTKGRRGSNAAFLSLK